MYLNHLQGTSGLPVGARLRRLPGYHYESIGIDGRTSRP